MQIPISRQSLISLLKCVLAGSQRGRALYAVRKRKRLNPQSSATFSERNWFASPAIDGACECEHHFCPLPIQLDKLTTESVIRASELLSTRIDRLLQTGISKHPSTHAVHMLSYYRKKFHLAPENRPNAYAVNCCSISLPLAHGMTQTEQDYMIETIKKGFH